jgi:hypothetical protein
MTVKPRAAPEGACDPLQRSFQTLSVATGASGAVIFNSTGFPVQGLRGCISTGEGPLDDGKNSAA